MTLEELYGRIGGNYAEALSRLQMEKIINKFIVKFIDDQSCSNLVDAWSRGDEEAAFEAAHTAKGVCVNLSLSELASLANEITEALRPGNEELRAQTDVDALVQQLDEMHAKMVAEIAAYRDSL